jgi:hypothetical protein
VLGFQLHGRAFSLKPAIPDDWPGFEITYRYRSATYKIEVVRQTTSGGAQELEADGRLITDGAVPLVDDGAVHSVELRLARLPGLAPDPRAAAPAVKTPASGVTNGVSVSKSTSEKVPLPNRGQ